MNQLRAAVAGLAVLAFMVIVTVPAKAQNIDWTSWSSDTSSTATGSLVAGVTTVGVSYTGEVDTGSTDLNGAFNHWLPTASFTNGTSVLNAPSNGNLIALVGGSATVDQVTFSKPVVNPVVALWSLGSGTSPITYNFSSAVTIVAGGPNAEYGGSSIFYQSGSGPSAIISGAEGNGVVMFTGTFSSISWTVPTSENFHGFTVGISGLSSASAPEPGSASLLLMGGVSALTSGAALFRRRRK